MVNQGSLSKMTIVVLLLLFGVFSLSTATMIIDPIETMEFSTFLGGTADEYAEVSYEHGCTVVDSKGNIIVVGQTRSTDFPMKDAFQENIGGSYDCTISKFHPNGSLIFATYLGGTNQDMPTDVAVDSEDNIIVAGFTGSADFPVLNAFKSNSSGVSPGDVDGFITKFSEDGQTLLFSTFFGGSGNDWLYTMNVDSNDRIAISGTTDSTDFPLLNPHQVTNAGARSVFLAFIQADAQSLLFSTYLGTTESDHGRRVGFDSQGNVLVAGMCGPGDLATEGTYQEDHAGGNTDGFLAKFNMTGSLEFFTFLGGEDSEWGVDLAIDSADNVVVTGFTTSDEFPICNPYQDERAGYVDMFITKFTPDGQSLVFSTYLGGSAPDYGNAITIDSQDRTVVVGQTESADFPTTHPYSRAESVHDNVSVVVLDHDGSLLLSMVFGGESNDFGAGVAWCSHDSFVIIGYTKSPDFPIYDAFQDMYAGDYDMFVMKVDLQGLISPTTTSSTSSTSPTTTPTSYYPPDIGTMLILGAVGVAVVVVLIVVFQLRRK